MSEHRPAGSPLALAKLIERVFLGRLNLDEAELAIAQYAPAYQTPADEASEAELEAWADRFMKLQLEVSETVGNLLEDDRALRIADAGRLAVAAARLLGAEVEDITGWFLACRLDSLEEHSLAYSFFEQVEQLGRDHSLAAAAKRLICLVWLGRYEEAARDSPSVVDAARQNGRTGALVSALYARGRAEAGRGRWQVALPDLNEALELRKTQDESDSVASETESEMMLLQAIGVAARGAGQFTEALRAFEEGRRAAQDQGAGHSAAFLLSEIGYTWQIIGEFERGRALLLRAADEAERLGEPALAARWRNNPITEPPQGGEEDVTLKLARAQALTNAEPSRADEARALLFECLEEARLLPERRVESNVRAALAITYATEKKWLQAESAAREAIAVAEDAGDRGVALNFRINLANILLHAGRINDAEQELVKATAEGERIRSDTPSTELRQAVGVTLARAYDQLVFLAGTTVTAHSGAVPRPPQAERLIDIGQRNRAVNLSQWLHLGEAVEAAGAAELVAPLLELRGAEVRLEAAALALDEPLAALNAQRDARASQLWTAATEKHVVLPRSLPPSYPVSAIREVLEPGACLVDLLAQSGGISIVCLGPEGPIKGGLHHWPLAERTELLGQWRRALRHATRAHKSSSGAVAELGAAFSRFESVASRLDTRLFDKIAVSVAEITSPRRIYVIPHRELFLAPFWRLSRWFPQARISILPSPAAALVLQRRKRTLARPWMAVGDATGTLRNSNSELASSPRLERCDPRAALLRERLPGASLIHFAGHGWFDTANPYQSGLVVARTPESNADLLTASDPWGLGCDMLTIGWILGRLHLPNCTLAVLSACDTGLPRDHPASEFTSLPAALLVAGSSNVIATLWPVHDGAATLLMHEFYAALDAADVAPSPSPSQALFWARTRVAALTRSQAVSRLGSELSVPQFDPPFAQPFYLDAFQHYGID
jgi:tetratricopeptide (TPR) repeat protein